MFIKNKRNKGITLIALVVTIIVLLILAGISIQMLVGEGGILTNAKEAKDRTGEGQAKEELDMYLMEYSANKNLGDTTDLKTFLESKGYTVKERDDGKLEVKKDGYIFIVDPDTLSTTLKEKGVPELSFKVSEPNGEDGKVTVTVTVTNEDELGTIDSVTLTGPGTIEEEEPKTGATRKFKVDKNGTYTVEVKATTEGKQKTTKQDVKVDKITAEVEELGYGIIDVIWLNINNEVIEEPLSPNLYTNTEKALTPIKWNDETGGEENTTETDSSWYKYVTAIDEKTENTKSHWANAKNPDDDSYFVWIPRYAYRITYYASRDSFVENPEDNVLAYYDGNGLVNPDGAIVTTIAGQGIGNCGRLEKGVETVTNNEKSYIVHPAFYGPGSEDLGGGFGTDNRGISGIWVAKYEMSKNSKTSKPVSKPGVSSWTGENIEKYYTMSLSYDDTKESHLIKNSEWGAVAYLTHSQYGRNGYEISVNDSSNYITGTGEEGASTTGNMYGIYDMSGGAPEYVALYNTKCSENDVEFYGKSFAALNGASTKFATAYSADSSIVLLGYEFSKSKIGDALKEVVVSLTRSEMWFGDYISIMTTQAGFVERGGEGNTAGIFDFRKSDGGGRYYKSSSFRVVLVGP